MVVYKMFMIFDGKYCTKSGFKNSSSSEMLTNYLQIVGAKARKHWL